jgi:hypothetical protein
MLYQEIQPGDRRLQWVRSDEAGTCGATHPTNCARRSGVPEVRAETDMDAAHMRNAHGYRPSKALTEQVVCRAPTTFPPSAAATVEG